MYRNEPVLKKKKEKIHLKWCCCVEERNAKFLRMKLPVALKTNFSVCLGELVGLLLLVGFSTD